MVTVLVCGQVVPAGGLVPITVPTGAFEPTFSVVETRCTRCSAACAAVSVSFCTSGTTEVKGPSETRMVIVDPFDTRPAGLVLVTEPLGTVSLCTRAPCLTVKLSAVRTAVAWVTLSPDTEGTCVNRPEVSHQPPSPSPTPSAMITTTMSSRGGTGRRGTGPRGTGHRPRGPRRACASPPGRRRGTVPSRTGQCRADPGRPGWCALAPCLTGQYRACWPVAASRCGPTTR